MLAGIIIKRYYHHPSPARKPHNSDLRDSLEYLEKQMWGALICKRLSSSRFDLVRTRLTEACRFVYNDSAHTTYLETICVPSDVALI